MAHLLDKSVDIYKQIKNINLKIYANLLKLSPSQGTKQKAVVHLLQRRHELHCRHRKKLSVGSIPCLYFIIEILKAYLQHFSYLLI